MKKKNREINIFNLSMLDVICGAMGAFLIIMVVLMPYYKKETIDYQKIIQQLQQEIEQQKQKNEQLSQSNQELQQQLDKEKEENDKLAQENENMGKQLSKTFLLVHISWETKLQDVDLHIIDPNGKKFYFSKKTYENTPGELSVDAVLGPGNEVWISQEAIAGEYKIYADLFKRGNGEDSSKNPVISGKIVNRDGTITLPEITLTVVQEPKLMATFVVDSSGVVTLR